MFNVFQSHQAVVHTSAHYSTQYNDTQQNVTSAIKQQNIKLAKLHEQTQSEILTLRQTLEEINNKAAYLQVDNQLQKTKDSHKNKAKQVGAIRETLQTQSDIVEPFNVNVLLLLRKLTQPKQDSIDKDAHRKTQEYNDQKHLEEELHSEIRQLQASLNDNISANAKATELRACSVADLGSCPNQLSVFQLLKESDEAYQNLYKYIGDNIPDSESNSCAECSTDWVADLNTIMLSALKGLEEFKKKFGFDDRVFVSS